MEKNRLGDVCRVIPGYAFKSSDWQADGIPVVKIKNITTDSAVDLTETDCVPESVLTPKLQKFVLNDGDILLAMTGATAGKVGKVRTKRPILLNQRVAKIAPVEADHGFIWSVVSSQEYQEKFFYLADGAAQPNMSGGQIEGLEIPCPPLPVQRRIAGILSAYDELMENSQRRIRILEAMARALYREWFVHFRFPGHETVKMVRFPSRPGEASAKTDGDIPQGWEVLEFRHLFDIRYGKTLPKTEISDSGPYPVYGAGDVIGFYDKMLCPNKCALVTSRGNGSGTVWRTREAAFVTNNSLIMLPQEDRSHWDYSFVELLLKHANVMEAKTGSAQPQVTIENLNYVKAIVPTKPLVEKFCAIATPIYEQVDLLFRQIQNLRRTRDLLLPRLLSGQVELKTN